MRSLAPILLGRPLSLQDLAEVARGHRRVALCPEAREAVLASRRAIDAIASAGNMSASQMQSGFIALRPTSQIAKLVSMIDKAMDPVAMESFKALDTWASDNIPFPGAAYATYIKELYQQNLLVAGKHHVLGQRVDLGKITCPVLTVVTDKDAICPPGAAMGLNDHVGSTDKELLTVSGGHVGAVVGGKATKVLYPALGAWFKRKLHRPASVEQRASV